MVSDPRAARFAARHPRVWRGLERVDAAGRWLAIRLATNPRAQWCAFGVLLGIRVIALVLMMIVRDGPDGIGDERWLYLEHVRDTATFGFANPGYHKAQAMWHAPMSYLFWAGALSLTSPTIEAGRIIALALYLCSALVWVLIVRLLFPRGQRVLPAALFWVAPAWHTIEIRAYGLFLLLVLATTYLTLVPLMVTDARVKALALLGLAGSLALLVFNHLYGIVGIGCVGLAGLGMVLGGHRRRLGLGYMLCAMFAVATSIPWLATLAHDRRVLLPVVTAEREASVTEAATRGLVDRENVDQYKVNAFSTWESLRDELASDLRVNVATVALLAFAARTWIRGGAKRRLWAAVGIVLALSARNTLPQVAALAWMARRGAAWRGWGMQWVPVLLLGSFPAIFQYPAFYENYLTGYRVLPFLLFADVLREERWDWPARIALLHIAGLSLELVHWMTADPLHGWMPS